MNKSSSDIGTRDGDSCGERVDQGSGLVGEGVTGDQAKNVSKDLTKINEMLYTAAEEDNLL